MAGPRVRGNLRVDRVVDTLRLQQREQVESASDTTRFLTAASPYETIIIDPSGTERPAQEIRTPQVNNNADNAGIGTEFRITNSATSDITINLFGGGVISGNTLPATRTAIVFCTALGATPGTLDNGSWKIIILDAASTSGRADPNVISFNNGTDWGSASGGEYTLTIDPGSATGQHSKSPNPHAIIYDNTNDLVIIEVEVTPPNSTLPLVSNRIQIKVNENPDGRFTGRVEVY